MKTGLLTLVLLNDPLSFEYSGQADASGKVHFTIGANEDLTDLEVVITGDEQTIRKRIPALKAGQSRELTWVQTGSTARYELEIVGKGVTANYVFEVARAAPKGRIGKLQVRSSREDIVKRRTVSYRTSFPLERYEFKVYDGDGDVIARDVVEEKVPAGGDFTVTWSSGADVFMIWVRGEDSYGRFTEYKLVPWSVEIPHTEINFDTGKAIIKGDEAPKLDEAVAVAFHELDAIERVNKAVNADITPRLYIVGYTDTVGSTGSNDRLSLRRARSIAQYFHDKGFWAPIFYAGMGERALRVETGDNVDEARNRRAVYLINVQEPRAGGQIPGRWHKLASGRARPPGFELPPLPERWADYRESGVHNDAAGRDGGGRGGATRLLTDEPPTSDDPGGPDLDVQRLEHADSEPVGESGPSDHEPPPAIEDKPGASSQGCRVVSQGGGLSPALLGMFVLAALRRVRPGRSSRA